MKPRFSIIVPLYNKAPYVKKALESICAQSYRDFECIVVDDGSTDGSMDVIRDFVQNDGMSRLRLNEPLSLNDGRLTIISQPNTGVAAARNNGVAKSHGEYVCFLDADDWWEPNFLEEMDWLIKEYPDAGLYAMNFVYYKPRKTHVEHKNIKTGYVNYPEVYAQTGSMPVWTGAACMPRKVFDEMGGFPKGIKLGEDFLLWAKTALHYKVVFCEKPLSYYNNDVPASLRATCNLHAPEYNMLFHLNGIEDELRAKSQESRAEWKALLDKLRVSGLMDYWLNDEYHDAAAVELKKVDWCKLPKNAKAQYENPIWLIRTKCRIMQIGSCLKQKLIKMSGKK